MTFKITTKGNFKGLEDKIIKKGNSMSSFIVLLARDLNRNIKSRVVNKGIGSNGKMPSYTNAYSRARKSAGLQNTTRSLSYTGRMWKTLTTEELSKNRARMFFKTTEGNDKAYFNEMRTPFFSITEEESNIIRRELTKQAKL